LNALRAFESSARHLNFTRAGLELSVTQAAVSQQVRSLEERLGCALFTRLPRGLGLTDEGARCCRCSATRSAGSKPCSISSTAGASTRC
jgi:DNA-binding transcriptional LysR family regulator